MNSKLDGAGIAHTDQVYASRLRMPMTDTERAAVPESIRWTQTAHERSTASRRDRIAVTAYYMSEARGFTPGHDATDWLLAEEKIDAIDAGTAEG
jgi:Protein of unknown function (DUF2934)